MTKYLFMLLLSGSALLPLFGQAQDDIVERTLQDQKQVISYPVLREADILWQKEVWREIDVREKMNQAFLYPEAPFFELLKAAVWSGDLPAYDILYDNFSRELSADEIEKILVRTDSIIFWDGCSWGETTQIISEELGYQDIKRFRLKEVWYVDSRTGEMNVRILGIAPLKEQYDNDGNFKYEYPIFWVYYPHFRQLLSRESVFMPGNDAAAFSWEDLFETRKFSSTLYKTSNISDLRLKDMYSGVDRLLEADRINSALFNIEDGLWSH